MSVGTRLLGSLQAVLKTVSQRQRRPGESWLTTAMAAQLARTRQALAEERAQDVVDDIGASLDPQVMLLAATAATIGSAYDQLGCGNDRDQAFKLAVKLYGMASAEPGPAEALAIVPALTARGKRAQAIKVLRAVAAGYPDDVPVARLLASELEQDGDPGTALAYADLARRLGPGDAAERVACLKKAVTLGGGNPEFRARLGEALVRAGDAAQAVQELRAAIAGLPPDHDARVWLAEAVRISGTPSDALSIIDPIVARYPDKPGPRIARADIYAELGGREAISAALADLDHAIAVDSRSATAYRTRAQLLERLGRYPDAIAACDAILALAPDDGPALLTRGMARYALRELDEAAEDLSRAAELAEKAGDIRLRETALAWQGESLRMQRHYDEALGILDQAVAAGLPSAFTLGTRGQVLTALGRHAEAIETLTAASRVRPSPAWIHAALADVHRLDQRWDQALAELDMATIEGETAYTHFVRGLVLSGLAKTGEAADELRTAWIMQRSPEIAEELTRVLGLLGGRPALEESLAVIDETMAAQTATRTLLTRRAETLRTLGRVPEALAAVDDLLLADGEDSSLLGLKALVLADLGLGAEARDLADAVLARDRGNIFARCARIEACMATSEYEDALAAAEALLADVPGHRLGTLLKGVILCNIASYRETVQTLAPVLDDDSGQPLAHGLTGYALRRQDPAQPGQASDHLRRAVALDPGERWYQIELADILFVLGRQGEACSICQQVLDNAPTGSQVTARKLGYAGWAALLLNRPDEAVTLLGEGVQLDSTDLPLRFTFALSLFHTGRDELAMDEYQAVIAACEQLKSRVYQAAILAEALADLRRARERGRLDAVQASEEEAEARLSAALRISGGD
jgi:tetratricopeptide (TPR) repeat protein